MREIRLSDGEMAIVDDADFELISGFKWAPHKHGNTVYALANKTRRGGAKPVTIRMHRLILGLEAGDGIKVDHKNGNGLDNQRRNLRICTHSQNCCNSRKHRGTTSKYKGVVWHKRTAKWHAQANFGGHGSKCLGVFDSEIDAALAYDHAAREHAGEFAKLNFPDEDFSPAAIKHLHSIGVGDLIGK